MSFIRIVLIVFVFNCLEGERVFADYALFSLCLVSESAYAQLMERTNAKTT